MSFSETISPFFGRCALVGFYATAAMNIVSDWGHVAAGLDAHHVPVAPAVLLVALVLIFLGCISLFFGYHTRHGAVLLFGLTIVATFTLHPVWTMADGAGREAEFAIFSRDLAICGGLLLMVGMGPGPFAIDNRKSGGKGKKH
ncbi:MAG: DoxX family protein [Alphaproteobacteria bacterium]|nr:DoxX family protein [Alphaproteobacteria bacterium]